MFLIITLVRLGKVGGTAMKDGNANARAREILAERFARGELDAETFRGMKAELDK